jgi:16S rRNA (guanine1207-N2)-methyltransferase
MRELDRGAGVSQHSRLVVNIRGLTLKFESGPGMFSPRAADPGTLAMLSCVECDANSKVVDLRCGYGLVGVVAARLCNPSNVFLLDNSPHATVAVSKNLVLNGVHGATVVLSDGFRSFSETGFTYILSNPPYHSDFSVPKHFIEKGFNRLMTGGKMFMVTMRETWYRRKFEAIIGSVTVHRMGRYLVFEATKRTTQYAHSIEQFVPAPTLSRR